MCPFTGTSKQGAALLAEISEKHAVLVGLEHAVAFGDALAIRYWDGDLAAYQVSVRVSDPNPTVERTEVLLLGDWKTVELRRGQRIAMPRLSLVAEARDDTGKVIRRYQLVAADLSGVGCGVTVWAPRLRPMARSSCTQATTAPHPGCPFAWCAYRRADSGRGAQGWSSAPRAPRSASGSWRGATRRPTPRPPEPCYTSPR